MHQSCMVFEKLCQYSRRRIQTFDNPWRENSLKPKENIIWGNNQWMSAILTQRKPLQNADIKEN